MAVSRRSLPVVQAACNPGEPPLFERIAIFGLGLIGGSIALAARQKWPRGLVIGIDEKSVLELAMLRHAIDVAADDPVVAAEADLVILAAPVHVNIELLATLAPHITGSALVTDVGSTKRLIVERAAALPPHLTFIGGHPLGGAPRGGLGNARPDLFTGRPWLFTPTGDAGGAALDKLQQLVVGLGARPHVMTAAEHDRLLAFLSHLPQLAASALMHVVGEAAGGDGLALTGRGLADTTRLASSPAPIWRDICESNADELGGALDILIGELQLLRGSLGSGDTIDRVFESAARWRAMLLERGGRQPAD